ncbi:hypothetical protein ACJX0J_010719 [Zea mays]
MRYSLVKRLKHNNIITNRGLVLLFFIVLTGVIMITLMRKLLTYHNKYMKQKNNIENKQEAVWKLTCILAVPEKQVKYYKWISTIHSFIYIIVFAFKNTKNLGYKETTLMGPNIFDNEMKP